MTTKILHIETSTEICSVALSLDNQCISIRENTEGRSHATMLTPFIEEILTETGITINNLNAVSISEGPGSYTGLRIGLSTAKGLCYGAGIPLLAVSTLLAMSKGLADQYPGIEKDALLCPMIDARRMEVYTSIYTCSGKQVKDVSAEVIDELSFIQYLKQNKIYFFGNGASKCKSVIKHPNASFIEHYVHSARYLIPDALNAYERKQFVDVAYFEPFYLKDFIAGKPRNILDSIT